MLEVMSRTEPENVGSRLQIVRDHPIRVAAAKAK